MKIISAIVVMLLVSAAVYAGTAAEANGQKNETVIGADGNLRVPSNYRTNYEFLGSWAIAENEGKGSKQIHDVYASPGTVTAYRKDGRFPDGAVLVKEVYATATSPMTTGIVSHAKTLQGWFMMVKESENTHPDNKLWAEGWVWSWFDADNPVKTTSTDFKTDCQGCHVPAKDTDWVYTQGYPVLKKLR